MSKRMKSNKRHSNQKYSFNFQSNIIKQCSIRKKYSSNVLKKYSLRKRSCILICKLHDPWKIYKSCPGYNKHMRRSHGPRYICPF